MSYPIIDVANHEVTGYLRFIDDEIIKNRKLIGDMSREDYIEYLEEDYYRRKAIENKKLIEIQRQLANESWNLIPEENLLRSKLLSITEDSIPPMESF